MAFSLLCNREISIHALREEGDGCSIDLGHIVDVFLSTPSARRATTGCLDNLRYVDGFLSTPSARRATLYKCRLCDVLVSISIHALCEEGDQGNTAALSVTTIFLSTPSARRATPCG